jgi:hypothetical protein
MKKENFIAWQGEKFTIEWYFDAKNKSQALEYFNEMSVIGRERLTSLLITMADTGKIFNKEKFNNEGDGLFVFKPKPDRFLCFFFIGAKIIITNAFEKKRDKLLSREKEKALRYKEDYTRRVHEGTYYD